jgi:hypothetical protein
MNTPASGPERSNVHVIISRPAVFVVLAYANGVTVRRQSKKVGERQRGDFDALCFDAWQARNSSLAI